LKNLFFTLFLFSSTVFAADEKTSLISRFAHYAQVEIEDDVMISVEKVGPLKLEKTSDLELVKNVIRTLIKLDNEDPSRTAVMMLSRSYFMNLEIYKAAFAALQTKDNKIQLNEIESLMRNFKSGNG
jgi:hypothetical protein